MKKIVKLIVLFVLIFSVNAFSKTIVSIGVEGTVRSDKATVLSVVKSKVGTNINLKTIDEDIKNIYALGFYKTVSAIVKNQEGGYELIYKVVEKPSVRFITFVGNDEISDKKLQKALKIKPYNILNKNLINQTINQMMGMYASKSMFLTRIAYKIKPVENNRVDIEFDIKESKETVIRDVNVIGNRHINTDDLLDDLSNHRKKGPYILTFLPWFYTGKLRINDLGSDAQKIRDQYLSKGYLDVDVKGPLVNVEPDTGNAHIDFSLKEGKQYILKSVKFKDIAPFKAKQLREVMNLKVNEPFDIVTLRRDIEKITDMYGDKGYAFADVNPRITKKKNNAYLTLVVNKGPLVYINRITIVGNTKTHDNVIRRELRLKEGDLYSISKIRRSRQKIMNLNFFKSVKISTKRVGKNRVDMKVAVEEKPTGMLTFGFGYGSYDKISAQASVSEQNLFGSGIYGKLSANVSAKTSLFDLHLVNPWVDNRPISAGIDIFHQEYEGYDYTHKSTGFVVTVAKRFWDDDLSVGSKYSLSFDKITLDTDYPGYYLEQEEGSYIESAVVPFIKYNSLDNNIFPTSGINASNSLRIAGLGGDRRYVKNVLFGEYFHRLPLDLIGHIKGEIGYASGFGGKEVPVNRRFFLGGINNLRGFDTGTVSPKDADDNYIGGNRDMYASGEIIFPILSSLKFYGVCFYDIGNSWLSGYDFSDLRKDAGAGIRWISPLGPVRIEVGKNLSPRDGEKTTVFQFSMGALF